MRYFDVLAILLVIIFLSSEAASAVIRTEESSIFYVFFSQQNFNDGVIVNRTSVETLADTPFTTSKDTVFIIHGWNSNSEVPFLKEDILNNHDVNLFIVDWGVIANQDYLSSHSSIVAVGIYISDFINTLALTFGLSLATLTLVGHSLGAHVAGNTGAALYGQTAVIVGLDPAGPLFSSGDTSNRLDPTDAIFVKIIHTNGGVLGYLGPLGHADYYPNGGTIQPGCGSDLGCPHARAVAYYGESLGVGQFSSRACSSYLLFSLGLCNSNPVSLMGEYYVDTSASGRYYLNTNSAPPYGQG